MHGQQNVKIYGKVPYAHSQVWYAGITLQSFVANGIRKFGMSYGLNHKL